MQTRFYTSYLLTHKSYKLFMMLNILCPKYKKFQILTQNFQILTQNSVQYIIEHTTKPHVISLFYDLKLTSSSSHSLLNPNQSKPSSTTT